MNELRKTLGALFGFTAFWCGWTVVSLRTRAPHGVSATHAQHAVSRSLFFVSFMLACCIFNAAASWAILTSKRSARILGVAASVMPLLMLMAIILVALIYRSNLRLFGVPWVAVGLAAVGLIAFLPRSAATQTPKERRAPMPVAGDGTNKWVNKSVWIVGTVAFLYGLNLWWHWANLNGLSSSRGISYILQLVLADFVIVLVHEFGHAVTGLALGMKLRAFIVGPFQWRIREGKWKFRFQPGHFFSTGGATAVVPTNPQQSHREQLCMIAAGPFASLLLGLISLWAALSAPGHPWEQAWLFLSCVGTLSLLVGVLNLVPFQSGSAYSDGAQIYQLLAEGPWADYHSVASVVGSTLVTPLRPRDYDIDAIHRASASITRGPRAMLLHLYASSYYLDRGQIREAAQAFTQAESVCQESVPDVTTELHTAFIFRKAFLHHDAIGARAWWDRMEAKKPTHFNVDYWLARGALLWIENNQSGAREAWEKASSLAQKLPKFGAYEFDRYRCGLLRKALDEPSPAKAAEPLSLSGRTFATLPPDPLPAS